MVATAALAKVAGLGVTKEGSKPVMAVATPNGVTF